MDYSNNTIYELKEICRQRKIRGYGGKNKDALITLLGGTLAIAELPVEAVEAEPPADPKMPYGIFTYIFEKYGTYPQVDLPTDTHLAKMLTLIDASNPRYVLLENIKNLVLNNKGATYELIRSELEKHGYFHRYRVLDIGVNNRRIYAVCLKDDEIYNLLDYSFEKAERAIISVVMNPTIGTKYTYSNSDWILSNSIRTDDIYDYQRMYVSENMGDKVTGLGPDSSNYTVRECFNFDDYDCQ